MEIEDYPIHEYYDYGEDEEWLIRLKILLEDKNEFN